MSHTLTFAMACVALSVTHLAIGLMIGLKRGRNQVRRLEVQRPRWQPVDGSDLKRLRVAWLDVRLRLADLASCTCQATPDLPRELILEWRRELERTAANVCRALDRKLGLVAPSPAGPGPADTAALPDEFEPKQVYSEDLVISNSQILELLDDELSENSEPNKNSHRSGPLVRYPFAAKQPLAPAVRDQALLVESFSLVQCHDISIRDIRYFVDDPPLEPRVIIGLGIPEPVKWVAAEIEDSRSTFRYGRVGYLVTARIVASIDKREAFIAEFFRRCSGGRLHDTVC